MLTRASNAEMQLLGYIAWQWGRYLVPQNVFLVILMKIIASGNTYILLLFVTNLLQINNVYEFHNRQIKHTSDVTVPFSDVYYSPVYFHSTYYGQKL